jgi:hypothetical protein
MTLVTAMMESMQTEAQMATMQVGGRYHSKVGGRELTADLVGKMPQQVWAAYLCHTEHSTQCIVKCASSNVFSCSSFSTDAAGQW